jgi:uncharacterized protein (DUF2267 family)
MALDFNKHAQKGNHFLNELAQELGDRSDKAKAGKILRAVFKTLRDHLTLAENFQLLSQLPMALKGIYVDAWMPTHVHEIGRKKIDFVEEVLAYENKDTWARAEEIETTLKEIRAVFKTLKKYISEGEFNDLEAVLPRQLKKLLRESIYQNNLSIKLVTEKENEQDHNMQPVSLTSLNKKP